MHSFQRRSSFDQEAYARKEWQERISRPREVRLDVTGKHNQSRAHTVTAADGPLRSDLERWYESLRDIISRESDGDVDHSTELEDLKDEIYGFLY
jgi:hypothetical protein